MTAARLSVRQAVEADHRAIVGVVDGWWGRPVQAQLPRLWLRHFAGTAFVARDDDRLAGFLVGFMSQDDPTLACLHLVGVTPGRRRRGIGRSLVERFADAVAARGATRATTTAWPGDRGALAFLGAVGFTVDAGPGTHPLYGTPAYTDWNRDDDDQVVLDREIRSVDRHESAATIR